MDKEDDLYYLCSLFSNCLRNGKQDIEIKWLQQEVNKKIKEKNPTHNYEMKQASICRFLSYPFTTIRNKKVVSLVGFLRKGILDFILSMNIKKPFRIVNHFTPEILYKWSRISTSEPGKYANEAGILSLRDRMYSNFVILQNVAREYQKTGNSKGFDNIQFEIKRVVDSYTKEWLVLKDIKLTPIKKPYKPGNEMSRFRFKPKRGVIMASG